jgi:hypothetical protein
VTDLRVEELTTDIARVRLTWKVLTVEIRDAKTKRLIERQPANQTPVLLFLERIDGRWLVGQLTITDEGGS